MSKLNLFGWILDIGSTGISRRSNRAMGDLTSVLFITESSILPMHSTTNPMPTAANAINNSIDLLGWPTRSAAAREELAAGAGQVEDKEGADAEERAPSKRGRFEDGHLVVIYILDLEDAVHHPQPRVWNWNATGVKKLGVLYEASLNALHVKVSSQLLDGRKTMHIRSDDELEAFLHLTEARPIKLLIVLHRDLAVRANSPPPAVCNASTYYFNLGRFDGPEYYMDEIEDSEEEVARRTGGRRGVPRRDHKFEESLEDCRRRIRRQQYFSSERWSWTMLRTWRQEPQPIRRLAEDSQIDNW
ncbi:hypothetical protein BGX38DRAFT_1146768 [Terfezia claveryi]|nr:hypothetical protein BGX38DRAFT_1146768 [Terfezia claveryi]